MEKIVFILNIFFCTLSFGQSPEPSFRFDEEYNNLMNYVPENFNPDTTYKPESQFLNADLNSINDLQLYYSLIMDLKLTEYDKKWLESRIDLIAMALFLDGKRILISSVGGYAGCPDEMIDTIKLNDIEITNLKLCHTCIDGYQVRKFISVFNNRMYSLMGIEPPDSKTRLFYGQYSGLGIGNYEMKLVLTKDREFKFWKTNELGSDFTQGYWKNKSDTLILDSQNLNGADSLNYALSDANWIAFEGLEVQLKRNKLIQVQNKKWKLRKIIE